MEASRRRDWDKVIAIYDHVLTAQSASRYSDLKAQVFASLAETYMEKSDGKDTTSYLLLLARALSLADTPRMKKALEEQMHAISIGLERPEIGNYWRDSEK